MVQYFIDGGPLMWPLLATALVGIAVLFERVIVLGGVPKGKKAEKTLENIEVALRDGGLEGAAKHVSKGKGILNYIYARLLKRYDTLLIEKKDLAKVKKDQGAAMDPITQYLTHNQEMNEIREELMITVDDATRTYVMRFIAVMNTCAAIAPLLGLLGTITGMIVAFNSIATSGTGDPKVVAGGISQALITTAAGLFIAIPATVFYQYLVHRANAAYASVEIYALAFANTLLAKLEQEKI
jgi:biopolymer transport protein ExbB/TolQ